MTKNNIKKNIVCMHCIKDCEGKKYRKDFTKDFLHLFVDNSIQNTSFTSIFFNYRGVLVFTLNVQTYILTISSDWNATSLKVILSSPNNFFSLHF